MLLLDLIMYSTFIESELSWKELDQVFGQNIVKAFLDIKMYFLIQIWWAEIRNNYTRDLISISIKYLFIIRK